MRIGPVGNTPIILYYAKCQHKNKKTQQQRWKIHKTTEEKLKEKQ